MDVRAAAKDRGHAFGGKLTSHQDGILRILRNKQMKRAEADQ